MPSAYSGKVQGRRDPVPNTIATATTKKDKISEAAKSQGPERADVISDKTSTTKVDKNPNRLARLRLSTATLEENLHFLVMKKLCCHHLQQRKAKRRKLSKSMIRLTIKMIVMSGVK